MRAIRRYPYLYSISFLTLFFFTAVKGLSAHFCGNELVLLSFLGKPLPCEIKVDQMQISDESCCKKGNSNCCQSDLKILDYESFNILRNESSPTVQIATKTNIFRKSRLRNKINTLNISTLFQKSQTWKLKKFIEFQTFLC